MATGSSSIDQYKLTTAFDEDNNPIHTTCIPDLVAGGGNIEVQTKWKRKKDIGVGGFGVVWLEEEEKGQLRAVKRLPQTVTGISWSRELNMLAQLRSHQNLFVQFFGWYENSDFIFLAMEYIQYGDLGQYLKEFGQEVRLQAKEIIGQILEGLVVLHQQKICHRDLKPQNILIASTSPIRVKIADFGLSKQQNNTSLRTNCGTSGYLAPELLGLVPKKRSYTYSVDMWSLGILAHEILTLVIPFLLSDVSDSDSEQEQGPGQEPEPPMVDMHLLSGYCRGTESFPDECLQKSQVSGEGIRFVMALLAAKPRDRMSATEALSSPWLLDKSPEVGRGQVANSQAPLNNPATLRKTLSLLSDEEDTPRDGFESGSGSDFLRSTLQSQDVIRRTIDREECYQHLSSFIKSNGLKFFYPKIPDLIVQRALEMHSRLRGSGCSWEMAGQLLLLTLYDLAILVDDSSHMNYPTSILNLQKIISCISSVYGLARDEGVITVQFLNSHKGKENVTAKNANAVLKGHVFNGVAKVGIELESKILGKLVFRGMEKPLLIIVLTSGNNDEDPRTLQKVITKKVVKMLDAGIHNSMAFQFVGVGIPEAQEASGVFRLADHLYIAKAGGGVDYILERDYIEQLESAHKKWILICKLLLKAISHHWDSTDELSEDGLDGLKGVSVSDVEDDDDDILYSDDSE